MADYIDMDKIKYVVRSIPMTKIQEEFYLKMLEERKEHIIKKAIQLQKERKEKIAERKSEKRKQSVKKYVPHL